MTFQEIVRKAPDYIGGAIETKEGDGYGLNSYIVGMSIDKDCFTVYTQCGNEVSVNVKYSTPRELQYGVIVFMIPLVGTCYLYKQNKKEQQRCI